MLKTVIREKLTAGYSPAETLNRTNDQFLAQNPENQFTTVFIAVLNTRTGELLYCNAGHNPPLLLQEECAFLNPEPGIALGLFENADLKDETCSLAPGQGILLYTDGVSEAVSPERQFFGEERLREAVKGFSDGENAAEETVLRLSGAVDAFCGENEAFDDMAVLALVYRGDESIWQSLPVELSAFDKVKEAVFAAAGDSPETRQALLACDEALTNIVCYSGASSLDFSCSTNGDMLSVSFSDNGIPFDPTAAIPMEKEFERLDGGGMGLNLIRLCTSSMH
jgi:anti-sigma regulatory factor (Ser/Thr protein kinase)